MYAWDFTIKMIPVAYCTCKLFSSRKYPYSPHRRDWNFLGEGGGFYKTKKFKEMYEAQSKFPEGWGWGADSENFPSVGEVWIFSGTTHSINYSYNVPEFC